jgi:hypothetical protein
MRMYKNVAVQRPGYRETKNKAEREGIIGPEGASEVEEN